MVGAMWKWVATMAAAGAAALLMAPGAQAQGRAYAGSEMGGPGGMQALWQGLGSAWEPAHAYSLGVAAGSSHWNADCPQTLVCDRNDTSYRVTAAWQLVPNVALELFYVDEGQVKARAWQMVDNTLQTTRLRVRGGGLGAAWWVPLDTRWFGVLRAGAVFHQSRFDENQDASTTLLPTRETHDHFDPALGLGLSYRFSPQWQIDTRLDWTATRLKPTATSLIGGGTTGAHQWSLGITYGF